MIWWKYISFIFKMSLKNRFRKELERWLGQRLILIASNKLFLSGLIWPLARCWSKSLSIRCTNSNQFITTLRETLKSGGFEVSFNFGAWHWHCAVQGLASNGSFVFKETFSLLGTQGVIFWGWNLNSFYGRILTWVVSIIDIYMHHVLLSWLTSISMFNSCC